MDGCWAMISKNLKSFLADESGQSTVEYVLLLVVMVTIIIKLGTIFKDKMLALIQGPMTQKLKSNFFARGGVHKFFISVR